MSRRINKVQIHHQIDDQVQVQVKNNKKKTVLLPSIQEKITSALNNGDSRQLNELVLEGFGDALFGKTSWGEDARKFLKGLPLLMDNIKSLHASITYGDLNNVDRILNINPSLLRSKDELGLMPIHLATESNQYHIVYYFAEKYPSSVFLKDNVSWLQLNLSFLNTEISYIRNFDITLDIH